MIIDNIKSEQLQARKIQDKFKTKVLTALYSEASIVGKNNGNRETNDDEAISIIKSFIKKLNETIVILKDKNKDVSEQIAELSIYESFLPKQLAEEEIKSIVIETIKTIENPSMKSMGIVMSVLNTQYKGLFDGSIASKVVKEELSKGL